jgi:formate/nitrite transporter
MAEPNPVDALAPGQIEEKAETIGTGKARMPRLRQFILGMMAGVFIGFGAVFMTFVKADGTFSFATSQLLGGLAFSFGLFMVLCAGAELFTGNSLMICGRLSGRYSVGELLSSWGVVYVGNLVGSLLLVLLVTLSGIATMGDGAVGAAMVKVAAGKVSMPWWNIFFRGVLCNMLVCLAVWMSFGGHSTVDKLVCAALPVAAFVACGFEHCVANMYFIPVGIVAASMGFAPEGAAIASLNVGGFLYNLSAATLGNLLGGVVLIGCGYWLAFKGGKK